MFIELTADISSAITSIVIVGSALFKWLKLASSKEQRIKLNCLELSAKQPEAPIEAIKRYKYTQELSQSAPLDKNEALFIDRCKNDADSLAKFFCRRNYLWLNKEGLLAAPNLLMIWSIRITVIPIAIFLGSYSFFAWIAILSIIKSYVINDHVAIHSITPVSKLLTTSIAFTLSFVAVTMTLNLLVKVEQGVSIWRNFNPEYKEQKDSLLSSEWLICPTKWITEAAKLPIYLTKKLLS